MDSPLSITASITGILTFITAIVAFIYIRYQTLMRSEEEIMAIMDSVASSIEDTVRMVHPGPNYTGPREPGLVKFFAEERYAVELDILSRICGVMGSELKDLSVVLRDPSSWLTAIPGLYTTIGMGFMRPTSDRVRRDLGARTEALRKQHDNESLVTTAGPFLVNTLRVWVAMRRVTGTPILWRWYRERGEILRLTQRRDMLQSRQVIITLQTLNTKIDELSARLDSSLDRPSREALAPHEGSPEAAEAAEQHP